MAQTVRDQGTRNMAFAYCPECRSRIYIENRPRLGQLLACPCCDAISRIVDLDPLELGWARKLVGGEWEEDWEVELERA